MNRNKILNDPVYAGHYLLYQNSFQEEKEGAFVSGLLLVDEPGGWLLEVGCYIVLLGMIWILWFEPYFKRKQKKEKLESFTEAGAKI